DGRPRKTFLRFALGKVGLPALSPDGKRLALVTNRDFPRTARYGGNLSVCAADGSRLRRLTNQEGGVFSDAWSHGRPVLYAVRRIEDWDKLKRSIASYPLQGDLYRIAVETGQVENLTRSGKIDKAWMAGQDLLLKISAYEAGSNQQGIFRIAPEKLAQATAHR